MHSGAYYNTTRDYTLRKPMVWQTNKGSDYTSRVAAQPVMLACAVPFDTNYGRSDWLQRGYPYSGYYPNNLVDDAQNPVPADFALDKCDTTYRFLPHFDELIGPQLPYEHASVCNTTLPTRRFALETGISLPRQILQ